MNGILGKKIGMTHVFGENGDMTPVTIIHAEPGTVVAQRRKETNGYSAVQVGFHDTTEKHIGKPRLGHFKKAGVAPKRHLAEFRCSEDGMPETGSQIDVSIFNGVEKVSVIGTSRGRGFSGTIRRHNFSRGPETHGSKNTREPGSIGSNSYPARVYPGMRMAGQYGNKRVTVKGLKLVKLDTEKGLLFIKGAVPGPINGSVIVRKA